MKNKVHIILYVVLVAALVAAIIWGVSMQRSNAETMRVLEDGYTQRVLETQEHLQAIGIKLGKAPVADDPRTQVDLLTGISKQADDVVSSLASLPLSHVAMSDTIKFCNQVSEYSMELALVVAGGTSLSDEDVKQLGIMEEQCSLLLGQFVTAQNTMVSQSLQMAGDDNVYYNEAENEARPLEQVAQADNGMDYPSMIYDGAFSDARHYGTPKALGDERIDAVQAVDIAKAYVGEDRVKDAQQAAETAGTLASYGVTLTLADDTLLNAEITKQGGKVLWIMPEHAAFAASLTLEECRIKGEEFLAQNEYAKMQANFYQVYDGLAVINFVAMQDDVLLYPDLVKVQIRMDTGEVVGIEANNYLLNHEERSDLTPMITADDAMARVSTKLDVGEPRLCVIPFRDMERLCFEIPGTYAEHEYRVYIDAKTGEEVQILMILDTADGVLSA